LWGVLWWHVSRSQSGCGLNGDIHAPQIVLEWETEGSVLSDDYEIQLDDLRRRVWVHGSDGSTVARFDNRFGMDIHRSITEQLAGALQCLYCTHEQPSLSDWETFRCKVEQHFGVLVPASAVEINL